MTTYVMIDHYGHRIALSDLEHAEDAFDFTVGAILCYGGSGQSVTFGPAGGELELRVDIDIDAGLAALTWLPDTTIGVELDPGPPITVVWSHDAPQVTVPGTVTRVSAVTARRAVLEYLTTGERPTCVQWSDVPDAATLPRAMFYRHWP